MDTDTSLEPTNIEPYPGKVYLDACLLSFGGSTIQYTYEGASLNHARYLHDQMHAFSPILAVLFAGSSVIKGRLLDIDMKTFVVGAVRGRILRGFEGMRVIFPMGGMGWGKDIYIK